MPITNKVSILIILIHSSAEGDYRVALDLEQTADNYAIVDGHSPRQFNNYDCGVFAIKNIEKYVTRRPEHHNIVQPLMKLFRLNILHRIYRQGIDVGHYEF